MFSVKIFSSVCLLIMLWAASPANALNLLKRDGATGTVGGCSAKFTENLAYDKPAPTIPASLTNH